MKQIICFISLVFFISCGQSNEKEVIVQDVENAAWSNKYATLDIKDKGNIMVRFYGDRVDDLRTLFIKKATSSHLFVVDGVIPQTSISFLFSDKRGGEGSDEENKIPMRKHYANLRGTVFVKPKDEKLDEADMSKFFVNLSDNRFYDGKMSVIGKVKEGMDIIDKVATEYWRKGDKKVEITGMFRQIENPDEKERKR